MEDLVTRFADAFRGRRVLVTGHTGFKGSWLTWWLHRLGAHVTGYALPPESPSMFEAMALGEVCESILDDIRDAEKVAQVIDQLQPDLIFHLAAQPLVLNSYADPLGTIQTNVMGTTHVLDALRRANRPAVAVIVTSDKCYENDGTTFSFRETDPLGGHDVYSMSKGAAELVTASYRRSFFGVDSPVRVASARAGNVIGGGDWAANRLVPDSIRALSRNEPIGVRNPTFVRPWQHVLEPVSAYLLLAARLAESRDFAEAWNFGPHENDICSVEALVHAIVDAWGSGESIALAAPQPHEAPVLRLSTGKAATRLGWTSRWPLATAVQNTVAWYREQIAGADAQQLRALTDAQIDAYMKDHDGRR
jgi:CDP-glucose 4,6-dehydratase